MGSMTQYNFQSTYLTSRGSRIAQHIWKKKGVAAVIKSLKETG